MTKRHLISRLRRTDWDFAGTFSESKFSPIHWYPGRYVSQLPATFIGLLTRPNAVVLDPFVGSGTTLVEAQRLGRQAIGIDLNPVACLIARAKTLRLRATTVSELAARISSDAEDALNGQLRTDRELPATRDIPATVQADKWYSPRTRSALRLLWALVSSYRNHHRLLAMTAFSTILLPVCREQRHWGYVCDNTEPNGENETDVLPEFRSVLGRLTEAYRERDQEIVAREGIFVRPSRVHVICKDAVEAMRGIESGSIDLVVTSPPYFGVSDYTKAQRLSMEWLGVEIEPLRRLEIGARSKRHRLTAAADYVSDLRSIFAEVYRCLRRSAPFVMVVGESASRESVIADIVRCARLSGFCLELDLNRTVSSQRNQAPSIVGEHLLLFARQS